MKAYQAKETARAEGFRARLETTWEAIQGAMDQAQRAVRTHEDGTVEDRSLSALPALFNQAHRNLELLGRATGELSNDGEAAMNVTLVRVLSVPRMPGVQTVPALPSAIPASRRPMDDPGEIARASARVAAARTRSDKLAPEAVLSRARAVFRYYRKKQWQTPCGKQSHSPPSHSQKHRALIDGGRWPHSRMQTGGGNKAGVIAPDDP